MTRFAVGDHVTPKPEWVGNPNNIPSGIVRSIAPFGKDGALYVGNERRAFAACVFDQMPTDAVLPADMLAPTDPDAPIQADLFDGYDAQADAIGSYNDAVAAVGAKVRAGDPLPAFFLSDKTEPAE